MTRLSDIRKQIAKQRGVEFKKLSRKLVPIAETDAIFAKSSLMRMLEFKHKSPIDKLIEKGTIYEVGKQLSISPSTVSKWRQLIYVAKNSAFFDTFQPDQIEKKEETSGN